MQLRSIGIALSLIAGGTAIGATTQHFASASVSSGERPVLVSITPCRLADTRPGDDNVGARDTPLGVTDTHTIDAQEAGTPCSGRLPADASALSLNITALGATAQTYLTVWPGGELPTAASLNPAPGQPPVPNAVTTSLSVDGEFQIYNNAGSVHVVVDVNGYYVDHDHDDRYYTKTDSDGRYYSKTASDDRYYDKSTADDRFYSQGEVDALIAAHPTERPYVTEIVYSAGQTVDANDPGWQHIKKLGDFTKHETETVLKLTWTTHLASDGSQACRIALGINGGSPTENEASFGFVVSAEAVPVTVTEIITGLGAGDHSVDMFQKNTGAVGCQENGGNYRRTVLIEEFMRAD